MKVLFNAERIQFGRLIEIRWLTRDYDGTEAVATKVEYTKVTLDNYNESHAAPLAMSLDNAQGLMDELWRAGLRPTEGTGSAGSLAATERHLSDMQRIAFKLLEGAAP
jgi:hypothetical protein